MVIPLLSTTDCGNGFIHTLNLKLLKKSESHFEWSICNKEKNNHYMEYDMSNSFERGMHNVLDIDKVKKQNS